MANPTCTAAVLINDAAVYRLGVLNPKQQKALMILAKVYELAAIGGTDFTADFNLLHVTAAQLEVGITPDERTAARISMAFANAVNAGATAITTTYSDINSKLLALKKLVCDDDDALDAIDLYLTCQLGIHKAYVQ